MAGAVRGKATQGKVSAQAWAEARQRFEALEQFLNRTAEGADARSRTRLAQQFAGQLGVSRATFYRSPARHAEAGTVDALLPRPPGVKQGAYRLCKAVEAIIAEKIHGST
jgi:hypothetical protein